MKKKLSLVLAGMALLFGGCVVTSIYPFCYQKDIIFDSNLLGSFGEDKGETWTFERGTNSSYLAIIRNNDKSSTNVAHLFKLDGQLFIDLSGANCNEDLTPDPVPAHLLLRVDQIKPRLKVAFMSYNWLKELVATDPQGIRHIVVREDNSSNERIVLTADTGELQRFVRKHLKTSKFWDEDDNEGLPRIAPPVSSK